MNFKRVITALCVLTGLQFVFAQEVQNEPHPNWYVEEDPETVFITFGILRSVPLNDSPVRDAGGPVGVALGFDWFVTPEFTLGAHYDTQTTTFSETENNSSVGAIKSINLNNFGFQIGYYKAISRDWNWSVKAGIGTIDYRNSTGYDKFHETGISYKVSGEIGYRIDQTLAAFARTSPRYHKLEINAPVEIEEYLNKHLILDFAIGLRIHFHNPGG